MKKDKRVDEYISNAESFAKPILKHIRKMVHKSCPDIEETIKWNFPNFIYNNEILCSMASFKSHCTFGFWKESLIPDYFIQAIGKSKKAMKTFEAFSYSCKKEYVEWIKEAKTEETRNRRIDTAIEWMIDGKDRNWKYH